MDAVQRAMHEGSMRIFADREFAFTQRDFEDGNDPSAGRCVPLVAKWLAEKRDTSNGRLASLGRWFGEEDRSFVGASYRFDRNRQLYDSVAELQQQYSESRDLYLPFEAMKFQFIQNIHPQETTTDVAAFILRSMDELIRCRGIAILLDIIGQPKGHMVGIYRSNGGNLHFFDPNFGVYRIRDGSHFVDAWVETYQQINTRFFMSADRAALMYTW
jgi:hypothetical protein